jgi:hypothetical protein
MMRSILILLATLAMALPALAQSITDQLVAQLRGQGYDVLEMHDTWLGRVRVIAETDTIRREIVFNPGTGEILRDYAVDLVALAARTAEDARIRAADNDPVAAGVATDADMPMADDAADSFVLPEAIVNPLGD